MKVWDLPTRLFHWSIAALIGLSWWSAEAGHMDWHYRSGLAALAAIAFRLIWGFVGGSTARFGHFVRGPVAVLDYLRRPRGTPALAGHNPLGAYSVVAMLVILAVQVATGLLAVDVDGIESGPLSYLISFDDGRVAAEVHAVSFTALQVLVGLHIVSIAYYRLRGRRLVAAMITGRNRQLPDGTPPVSGGGALRAAVALAVALALAWWLSLGAPF